MSYLGTAWANSRAAVPLQLENHIHCSHDRLFPDLRKGGRKQETILFLTYLLRYIKTPLLVVWDRLPAHRSRLVGEFLDSWNGRIAIEYLPPYAPGFNPVEYFWGDWKHPDLVQWMGLAQRRSESTRTNTSWASSQLYKFAK